MRNDDELRLLCREDGVQSLGVAPANAVSVGKPPRAMNGGTNKHLWAILPESMPYILEDSKAKVLLLSKRITHTNLTGGKEAHSGGEMWFCDELSMWMSGASGRYPPRDKEELEMICQSIREMGYQVASLGWDDEAMGPVRVIRGEVSFQ